ncbi:hypothetical protein [Winogradskyella sediminis]|uniref:hypothetical protein n=1 Tax=Winogradskyella sediminis TaxID=1382466 RepID=UPI000E233A5F|nr:hypothetical protein [Winogradskyella sediminis]REG89199.1 hypothetical protein C8N41_101437 [Winogradskyella sediminis]
MFLKTKYLIILGLITIFSSCSTNDFTDPNDARYDDLDDIVNVPSDVSLSVDATDAVEINSELFGINNDWRQIPDNTFPNFTNTLENINYQLVRYPGGWESEFYDWENNTTPGWDNTPSTPGASVETLKNNANNYSIVIPTTVAMDRSMGSAQWNAAIEALKLEANDAITNSNIGDGIVEIGNEWWLQYAGGSDRAGKLTKYVNVAMELAAYIEEEFPDHTFKLLINGDYTHPEEFTTMKNLFVNAYDVIDGVALHTYVGYDSDTHNMADLEQRITDCANNFNPNNNFIYLSEWMPSRLYNDYALYMEAANIIPDIIQIYARAGANAGAYWPPINSSVPGLGITNWNYSKVFPVGQIIGDLSESFRGKALKTTSNGFHLAAALQDNETMVLYVTGGDQNSADVGISVEGFDIQSIESVTRFVPADYSETSIAEPYVTETSEATLNSSNEVVVEVNKEGKYQIYKIVLKGN